MATQHYSKDRSAGSGFAPSAFVSFSVSDIMGDVTIIHLYTLISMYFEAALISFSFHKFSTFIVLRSHSIVLSNLQVVILDNYRYRLHLIFATAILPVTIYCIFVNTLCIGHQVLPRRPMQLASHIEAWVCWWVPSPLHINYNALYNMLVLYILAQIGQLRKCTRAIEIFIS